VGRDHGDEPRGTVAAHDDVARCDLAVRKLKRTVEGSETAQRIEQNPQPIAERHRAGSKSLSAELRKPQSSVQHGIFRGVGPGRRHLDEVRVTKLGSRAQLGDSRAIGLGPPDRIAPTACSRFQSRLHDIASQ